MDRVLRARAIARRGGAERRQRAVLQWHRLDWHSKGVEKLRWDTQGHGLV